MLQGIFPGLESQDSIECWFCLKIVKGMLKGKIRETKEKVKKGRMKWKTQVEEMIAR